MRHQGDLLWKVYEHGLEDDKVHNHLQDKTYRSTKSDWNKTDFNHYDKPISTAFKTMLESHLGYVYRTTTLKQLLFEPLHKKYYQLHYPVHFPKLHLQGNDKGTLQKWQAGQDTKQWYKIFSLNTCKYFNLARVYPTKTSCTPFCRSIFITTVLCWWD